MNTRLEQEIARIVRKAADQMGAAIRADLVRFVDEVIGGGAKTAGLVPAKRRKPVARRSGERVEADNAIILRYIERTPGVTALQIQAALTKMPATHVQSGLARLKDTKKVRTEGVAASTRYYPVKAGAKGGGVK